MWVPEIKVYAIHLFERLKLVETNDIGANQYDIEKK